MVVKKLSLPILDLSGNEVGQIGLAKEIFAVAENPQLIAQSIRVYLSNQRRAGAKTKTRADVRGSRKKIWRQKGTGRARHGDRYAPIFVGGGVAHGPKGNQNFKLKLTKKMRRRALFSVLSAKFKEKEIFVVEGLKDVKPKTKIGSQILSDVLKLKGNCLIITPKGWQKTFRCFRNLPLVTLSPVETINPYLILKHKSIIFAPEAIKQLSLKVAK